MDERPHTDAQTARKALAQAEQASRPAALAARRWIRRYLLGMGLATAFAVLGSGLISHWGGAGLTWPRALATGVLWGGLFGGALMLLRAQQVRAVPARRQVRVAALASALVIGATMGLGHDFVAAYPIGAVMTFAVWASGAVWVGRPKASR